MEICQILDLVKTDNILSVPLPLGKSNSKLFINFYDFHKDVHIPNFIISTEVEKEPKPGITSAEITKVVEDILNRGKFIGRYVGCITPLTTNDKSIVKANRNLILHKYKKHDRTLPVLLEVFLYINTLVYKLEYY